MNISLSPDRRLIDRSKLTQHDFMLQVKRVIVIQRENPIVNRLNKTKVEKQPDLKQERDDRLRELRKREQAAQLHRVRVLARSC